MEHKLFKSLLIYAVVSNENHFERMNNLRYILNDVIKIKFLYTYLFQV